MKGMERRKGLRPSEVTWLGLAATLAVVATLGACTTTKRAAQLVIDHHVGMVRGGWDIVSGKAEEREQRMAKLQADIAQSQTELASESDPTRQLELLKQHVALQDALIAELLEQGHSHHGGGHQQAKTENGDEQPTPHEH